MKLIKIAANKNVNIICQKPFTNSYYEAIDAVNISNRNNILLIVHENFRFQPWYLKIKKILDNNSLGEVYQVGFRMRPGDGQGKPSWTKYDTLDGYTGSNNGIIVDFNIFKVGDL